MNISENGWTSAGGQHPQHLEKQIAVFADVRFLLYLPGTFGKKSRKLPLILFLHGGGERGEDLQKVKLYGPPRQVEEQDDFPFIVVSPQCPQNELWTPEKLNILLDEVIARLPVDETRIYLTGLSMGGNGTWRLAMAYPRRFAAIAPVCGWGERDQFCRLKDMPIWAFHGAKDPTVPVSETLRMVDRLKECGNIVKCTIYPEANHDAWTETYANPELYKWFLEHIRKDRAEKVK